MRRLLINGLYVLFSILSITTLNTNNIVSAEEEEEVDPCNRYGDLFWNELTPKIKKLAARHFGYDQATWNYEGVKNPIELSRYKKLHKPMNETEWGPYPGIRRGVIRNKLPLLGYPTAKCWDHFVNAYQGYTWWELTKEKNIKGKRLAKFAKMLGWNKQSWMGQIDPPPTDCMYWGEMSQTEKKGAKNFGWDRWSWNEHPCSKYCEGLYPDDCAWVPPAPEVVVPAI